jgi:hypothetical protein
MHLFNNDINLNSLNAKVNKPAIPGRPASYKPVTLDTRHLLQQSTSYYDREMSNRKANNLKGIRAVASKINGIVLIGMISSHQEKIGCIVCWLDSSV